MACEMTHDSLIWPIAEKMNPVTKIRRNGHDIREAAITGVDRLVNSRDFHASERLRQLLRYLVEQTLSGNERMLNQRQLAEDIFHRGDDFDPERDAIVRVEAGKLRQALAGYFAHAGRNDPLRIELPKGSYVPRFHWQKIATESPQSEMTPEPAIAIMPFKSIGDHRISAILADGLTDELANILNRTPYLRVISGYALSLSENLSDISLELIESTGMRFLLDGSLQCSGDSARVIARLHDVVHHQEIWSERFDYTISEDDLFCARDGLTALLAAHLADVYAGIINRTLIRDLDQDVTRTVSTHEAVLRFFHYFNSHSNDAYLRAREALEQALRMEPENPLIMALTSDIHRTGYSLGYTDEPDPLPEVMKMSHRALGLAPSSASCRLSHCYALLQAHDKPALLETVNPLLEDETVTPGYLGDAAVVIAFAGEWDRGCDIIKKLVRPVSTMSHAFTYPLVLQSYRSRDYARAWEIATRFPPATLFWQPMLRAAILGQLGRVEEAQPYCREVLDLRPRFPELARRFMACFLMEDTLIEELREGLDKAGLTTE